MNLFAHIALVSFGLCMLAPAAPPLPTAAADDWGLKKTDKKDKKDSAGKNDKKDTKDKAGDWGLKKTDKKKDGKKGKKKKGKQAGEIKKKKTTPGGDTDPAKEDDDSRAISFLKKLMLDPTDYYLAEKTLQEFKAEGLEAGGITKHVAEKTPIDVDKGPDFKKALGHMYIVAGKPQEAISLLSPMEKTDPAPASLHYLLAAARIEAGSPQQAIGHLQTALDKCKGGEGDILKNRIYDKRVSAALAAGDFSMAAESFVLAVKIKGQLDDTFETILSSLIAADEHERAETFVMDVIDIFDWTKYEMNYLNSTLADLLYSSGKNKEAMEAAASALSYYIPSLGDCESAVDLYMDAARELDKEDQAIGELLKIKSAACIFLRCAHHMEDYAGAGKALLILDKGVKKFPADGDLIVNYARALSKLGKTAQAVEFLKKKLKKLSSPDVIIEFATLLEESEGSSKAIKELEKISKSSKQLWVHMALEQYFDSINAYDMAKKENELLTSLDPKNPDHFARLGERFFREGNVAEAKKAWTRVKQLYASDFQGDMALADILFDHGMHGEAGQLYQALLKHKDSTIEVVKKLAVFYQTTGKIYDAESWWQVVLNSGESDFHARYEAALRLIQIWKMLGKLKQKEKDMSLLVERNPDDVLAKILVAEILFELNDADRAEKVVSAMLLAGVDQPDALNASLSLMEKLWKTKKDPAGFVGSLQKLIELYPQKKGFLKYKIANASLLTLDFELSRESLGDALDMQPNDLSLHEKAADIYLKMGDWDNAITSLKKIVAADQYNFTKIIDLSEALIRSGREKESIKLLERVVEKCGDQLLLDQAFSLLLGIKHSGQSQLFVEPYIYKLYKKSKSERLLKELIDIYTILIEKEGDRLDMCLSGPSKGEGEGGGEEAQSECSWVHRAGALTASVIIDGPQELCYEAAQVFQRVKTVSMAESILAKAVNTKQPVAGLVAMAAAADSGFSSYKIADLYKSFIKSENKDIKGLALIAFSLMGVEGVQDDVLAYFQDPQTEMRASAVLAAGILLSGDHSDEFGGKAREEIFKLLQERQFNQTYQAAIIALGQMGGQDAFSSLSNLYTRYARDNKSKWGTSASSIARKLALLAMAEGKLEDDLALPFLIRETWSDDMDISGTAAYALHALSCNRKGGACGSMIKDTVPVTASMKLGKFQLNGLLEQWAAHPSYEFSSGQMDYVSGYFRDVFNSEIDLLLTKEKPSSSNFNRFDEVLASMVSEGEAAWEPLTAHVPKKESEAVRKVIAGVYSERSGDFEKILEMC
ncbi:MAG: tetratricopeptide repeat protein, partial [Pseudomonadota bacterium]